MINVMIKFLFLRYGSQIEETIQLFTVTYCHYKNIDPNCCVQELEMDNMVKCIVKFSLVSKHSLHQQLSKKFTIVHTLLWQCSFIQFTHFAFVMFVRRRGFIPVFLFVQCDF